jgi:hypothetical protein
MVKKAIEEFFLTKAERHFLKSIAVQNGLNNLQSIFFAGLTLPPL